MQNKKYAVYFLMLAVTAGMSFPALARATQQETTTEPETMVQETPVENTDETEAAPFYEAEPLTDSASFSNDGNMRTQDRLDESSREFLTVTTRNGNIFYLVIDRNADGDNVHFLNQVDEADLLPLLDEESQKTYQELKEEESSAAESDIPVAETPPSTEPANGNILSKLKLGTIIPLLILVGALIMFLKDRFKKKDDHHGDDPDGPDEEYEFEDDYEDEFTDDDDYELPEYEDGVTDQNRHHHDNDGPKLWKAHADAQKQVDDFEKGKTRRKEDADADDLNDSDEDSENDQDSPDIIRLDDVDADEFFAGKHEGEDKEDDADDDDDDPDIDEEGVVNAEKALFNEKYFKKPANSKLQGNKGKEITSKNDDLDASSDEEVKKELNSKKLNRSVNDNNQAEKEAQTEDQNQPDDMFKRFGRPKKVYMFCYDDEEAI